jgi:hypothetical protein
MTNIILYTVQQQILLFKLCDFQTFIVLNILHSLLAYKDHVEGFWS